jgi:hypothetical protein
LRIAVTVDGNHENPPLMRWNRSRFRMMVRRRPLAG